MDIDRINAALQGFVEPSWGGPPFDGRDLGTGVSRVWTGARRAEGGRVSIRMDDAVTVEVSTHDRLDSAGVADLCRELIRADNVAVEVRRALAVPDPQPAPPSWARVAGLETALAQCKAERDAARAELASVSARVIAIAGMITARERLDADRLTRDGEGA